MKDLQKRIQEEEKRKINCAIKINSMEKKENEICNKVKCISPTVKKRLNFTSNFYFIYNQMRFCLRTLLKELLLKVQNQLTEEYFQYNFRLL